MISVMNYLGSVGKYDLCCVTVEFRVFLCEWVGGVSISILTWSKLKNCYVGSYIMIDCAA